MLQSRDPSFEAVHNDNSELVPKSDPVRVKRDFPQSILGPTRQDLITDNNIRI